MSILNVNISRNSPPAPLPIKYAAWNLFHHKTEPRTLPVFVWNDPESAKFEARHQNWLSAPNLSDNFPCVHARTGKKLPWLVYRLLKNQHNKAFE